MVKHALSHASLVLIENKLRHHRRKKKQQFLFSIWIWINSDCSMNHARVQCGEPFMSSTAERKDIHTTSMFHDLPPASSTKTVWLHEWQLWVRLFRMSSLCIALTKYNKLKWFCVHWRMGRSSVCEVVWRVPKTQMQHTKHQLFPYLHFYVLLITFFWIASQGDHAVQVNDTSTMMSLNVPAQWYQRRDIMFATRNANGIKCRYMFYLMSPHAFAVCLCPKRLILNEINNFSPILTTLRDWEHTKNSNHSIAQGQTIQSNRVRTLLFTRKIFSSHFGSISYVCRNFKCILRFENLNSWRWIEFDQLVRKTRLLFTSSSNRSGVVWFLFVQCSGGWKEETDGGFSMEMSKTKMYRCVAQPVQHVLHGWSVKNINPDSLLTHA